MAATAQFRVKEYGVGNKKVLFMLGGWKTKQFLYYIPAKILAWKGYRCIVYTYDRSMLSPDVLRTHASLHAVKDTIIQRIKLLKKQGLEDFSIYGFSLGSAISCMAADQEPAISRVILNTASASLAATVWSWNKRAGIKQSLIGQDYTLQKLEQAWYDLAPAHNIETFHNKRVLVYLIMRDKTTPYTQGKQLAALMRNQEVPLELITSTYGTHNIVGILNMYRVGKYLRFLHPNK